MKHHFTKTLIASVVKTSPQTFLTHHIQQITKAAVFYDAKAILRSVDVRKAVAARPQDGAPPPRSLARVPRSIAHIQHGR